MGNPRSFSLYFLEAHFDWVNGFRWCFEYLDWDENGDANDGDNNGADVCVLETFENIHPGYK